MQLHEFQEETAQVMVRKERGETPAQYITVRGLSSEDVLRIVKIHGPALMTLFDAVAKGEVRIDLGNTAALAALLLEQAPDVMADVIVISTDSEDVLSAFRAAKKLPITAQLMALENIAELTFVDQTPGELLGIVVKMLGGMNGLLRLKTQIATAQASGAG